MLRLRRLWNPTVVFGTALAVLIWGGAEMKVRNDVSKAVSDAQADLTNLSLLFQQDVLRTAHTMDRILKFLRRSYERQGFRADWPSLVQEDFTFNAKAAQIAIIDERGMMLTSSAMPRPKKPIDLSDREHFKVHRDGNEDILHVSRPVIGRASGKISIQFTRRFSHADGRFAGVIVISLDPSELVATYENLKVHPGTGFALIGADDIIRASSGAYSGMIGRGFPEGARHQVLGSKDRQVELLRQWSRHEWRLMATRPVEGTPLSVVVSAPDTTTGQWTPHHRYYGFAFSASLLVLMAAWHAAKRERQHKRQISDLAHNDPLTHLPNRRSFETRLDRLIDDPDAEPFLLHLIDIDHFKTINDTFGHPTGDQLLCAVAERLNSAVRSTDLVFRLGGDEFALVQSGDVTRDAAETVGARICRMMAEPFEIGSHRLHIGASVGIAALGTDVADRVSLLKAADVALYLAKSEGRGRFRLYNTEINLALERRRVLEAELEEAILGGQLELHYQPKVVLEAPVRVAGYEALVRWRHPDRGMIPPLEFISLAEDTGLIVELGEWVLTRACRDLMATGLDQTVAVNVSAVQFRKGTVVDAVERALAASGLPAERLEIEITESMLMDNNAVTAEQLKALRARGVKLALDDFGTGYSSLSYLERYPLDTVKIDRSFVAKLGIEARAAAIVRAIVVLAHELGMTPVAEGVETAAQADLLAALGCPMAQGYLFGRPEPAAKLWPSRAAA